MVAWLKLNIAEVARIDMAGRTGTCIMVSGVAAGGTIDAAYRSVVEHRIAEAAGITMTGRASTRKMIGRGAVTG